MARRIVLALACAAALLACSKPAPAPVARAAVPAAFVAEQDAWRAQRREALLQPDGWASLVGLHWLEPGAHYVGAAADNGIRLAMGPPQLGRIELKGNAVRFVPARGSGVTLDGKPARGALTLRADDADGGPSRLGFDDGRGIATVIKRGARFALRVKHADAPTRTGFGTLDYWPADPAWKITGRFVPHAPGTTLPIGNIIGTVEPMPNPGAVQFEHAGRRYTLEALDEGDGALSLIFADRTSGHGSYGAGRFLDAPRPDASGRVTLDFNQAYNPPCAFTPFATCPLPPPENRLDLQVTAGEKKYRSGTH